MAESESTRLEAIILAAGAGVRFGGGKLVAPFDGRPLLAGALSSAFAAPVRGVSVTVGADRRVDAVALAVAAALDRSNDLRLVPVVNSADGLGASLAAAALSLPADTAGVLVFLGDMPRVGSGIVQALADALTGPDQIVAPVHAGRRGHPVLFGADWIAALTALSGDAGAQSLIRQAGARLITVETEDAGVLFDVDRPEDLDRAPS